MSGKQPPETSYVQFTRDRLSRQQAAAFSKLEESIPKNESQWQGAREAHRFATPEDVHRTVSSLVQDNQGEFLPEDLRRLIYIAVCCVEHSENEAEAYRKYRSRAHAKDDLGELTIRNYMSLVRGLVALMDELYPRLGHRGFEATLLYVPLTLGALGHYKQAPGQFKSCFPTEAVAPEVQASLPLYLPFIVATRHPEHPYETVCRALGTNILGKEDYFKFVSVLQRGGPGHYDPVRDQWLPVTIPNLAGFRPFEIPESIQQIIARVGKQQDDPVSQDIPGAIIFRYSWSRNHQRVVDRVIDILKRSGFLSIGSSVGMQFFFRHESGSMVVPMGWQVIIIPAVTTEEPVTVTIGYQGKAEDVVCTVFFGLLLGQGTVLTTRRAIPYYAVSLPIQNA